MFWIGLMAGMITGVIAFAVFAVKYCYTAYGSKEDFENGIHMLDLAAKNRRSYLQVFTDDEILDTVVFEEKEK